MIMTIIIAMISDAIISSIIIAAGVAVRAPQPEVPLQAQPPELVRAGPAVEERGLTWGFDYNFTSYNLAPDTLTFNNTLELHSSGNRFGSTSTTRALKS